MKDANRTDRSPNELSDALDRCLIADQHRLRSRLRRLRRHSRGDGAREELARIAEQIERSSQACEDRRASIPEMTYPEELPVSARRAEIAELIAENQVVVLTGETGSGKTTQLPKIMLELGIGAAGRIAHTQPRRLAARSVAARIAQEVGSPLGTHVGYKVRFDSRLQGSALVKIVTDGVLLAEAQGDPYFNEYEAIIIDEAHERSLNIDFLLGSLKRLLPKRPDLKLVITSATIDPISFSEHFGNAPIIEVTGRTYPVEMRYEEPKQDEELNEQVIRAVRELETSCPGDVLVFCSGEREIRELASALRDANMRNTEILPLYARLSSAEQNRIFAEHRNRRIVLSTNIAETSVTVPGIRAVIDLGTARVSRYSVRQRAQRLPIEPVSKASANQRAGRCGRVAPGVCVRLYSQEDFESREEHTPPEIVRTNLAAVVLQMLAQKLGDPANFPFIDPPKPGVIRAAYETLAELGAIDEREELTDLGKRLARLPVDPRIGRMLIAADELGCTTEMLTIASALEVQDPRDRPHEKEKLADEAHAQFHDEHSDFIWHLNLWAWYTDRRKSLSRGKLHKACKQNYLSYFRLREWHEVRAQLDRLCAEAGFQKNSVPAEHETIHRALLTGLLTSIGKKGERFEYEGPRETRFMIFPGSVLFEDKPKWVMCAELVETARLYARTVAKIDPAWILQLGDHMLKRTHTDPAWDKDRGYVTVNQRITLQGLEIVPRRLVNYATVEREHARHIFIHRALVEGEVGAVPPFLEKNLALAARVRDLEHRARRADLLADHEAQHEFYASRIPDDVTSLSSLIKWLKHAEKKDPRILEMREQDLLETVEHDVSEENYPDALHVQTTPLELSYAHEPGREDDGVTVTIPLATLNQAAPARFEALVPGHLLEKITALIRSLPRQLRRAFSPAPDFAARAMAALDPSTTNLLGDLATALSNISGAEVRPEHFDVPALAEHLRMRYRVVDEAGNELDAGRDLSTIKSRLRPRLEKTIEKLEHARYQREGIVSWDFDDLEESVTIERGDVTVRAHPAIEDRGSSVALTLKTSRDEATHVTRAGLRRLFMLTAHSEMKFRARELHHLERMSVSAATIMTRGSLVDQLLSLIADRAFIGDSPEIRTGDEFTKRLDAGWNSLGAASLQVCDLADSILSRAIGARHAIDALSSQSSHAARADMHAQLGRLMPPDVFVSAPVSWLFQYPRYLEAIRSRAEKVASGAHTKDAQAMAGVAPWSELISAQLDKHRAANDHNAALEHIRWAMEEFRVQVFAQNLGTAIPISDKKLRELWDGYTRSLG